MQGPSCSPCEICSSLGVLPLMYHPHHLFLATSSLTSGRSSNAASSVVRSAGAQHPQSASNGGAVSCSSSPSSLDELDWTATRRCLCYKLPMSLFSSEQSSPYFRCPTCSGSTPPSSLARETQQGNAKQRFSKYHANTRTANLNLSERLGDKTF